MCAKFVFSYLIATETTETGVIICKAKKFRYKHKDMKGNNVI